MLLRFSDLQHNFGSTHIRGVNIFLKLGEFEVVGSGAVGGKTGNTSVLPGFSKIERDTVIVVLPSPGVHAAPMAPLD